MVDKLVCEYEFSVGMEPRARYICYTLIAGSGLLGAEEPAEQFWAGHSWVVHLNRAQSQGFMQASLVREASSVKCRDIKVKIIVCDGNK